MSLLAAGMIGSSLLGAFSSNRAASAQQRAASEAADIQRDMLDWNKEIYQENTKRLQPFYGSGTNALAARDYLLGIGSAPMIGQQYYDIEEFTETVPGSGGGSRSREPAGSFGEAFARANEGRRGVPGPGLFGGMFDRAITQTFGPGTGADARSRAASARGGGTSGRDVTRYRVNDRVFDSREAAERYVQSNPFGGQRWDYSISPYTETLIDEGVDAIEGGAAGRGGLFRGNTQKRLEEMRAGYVDADRNAMINMLSGVVGQGMNAASGQNLQGTQQAANAMQFGQNMGNILSQGANAQAAGIMGSANALQGGISNLVGYQTLNKLMNPGQGGGWWN